MNCKYPLSLAALVQHQLPYYFLALFYLSCLFNPVQANPTAAASPVLPDTAWRLQTAGHYQQLSVDALTELAAAHPEFCQSPRMDGRPLLWKDASGQPQTWHLSNESGVLRWWSEPATRQLIWAEGTQLEAAVESVSNQLAVFTTSTSTESLTVVWPEPSLRRYSAIDLSNPLQPQALWQWQAPMAGSVQTPVPIYVKTATGVSHALVMVSGADAVQPAFWLVDASSGKQLASQQYQRAVKTVELPFVLQDLVAAPAILDRNADGYTDRLYLVDTQGRLVQADLDPHLQVQSRVVADLADSAAEFKVQVIASRALLPDVQLSATNSMDAMAANDNPPSSHLERAAGTVGQPADVVILLSGKNEQSQLWVLIIPDSPAYTIQTHHLTPRDLGIDGIDAQMKTTATAGWFGTLPAAPVSLPQVLAGVLYLPVAPTADSCVGARQATRLVARHLFQGSAIYTAEQLAAVPTPFGLPAAVRRSSGVLALQDLQQGSLMLPQILGIRGDCRFCTEVLSESDYPKMQRMAIYQHESEVY